MHCWTLPNSLSFGGRWYFTWYQSFVCLKVLGSSPGFCIKIACALGALRFVSPRASGVRTWGICIVGPLLRYLNLLGDQDGKRKVELYYWESHTRHKMYSTGQEMGLTKNQLTKTRNFIKKILIYVVFVRLKWKLLNFRIFCEVKTCFKSSHYFSVT